MAAYYVEDMVDGSTPDVTTPRHGPGAASFGPASWPATVRAEVGRRSQQILTVVQGRVLDLSDGQARAEIQAAGAAGAQAEPAYDAIVSIAELVHYADLPLAIRGIAALLEPDGELHFVEPVGRPGWSGVLTSTAGFGFSAIRGQHLGRDVPLAVRSAGFIITDIERFTMPTPVWPLRPFVHARALRIPGAQR